MSRDHISPELALVDPTLAFRDTKEACPKMDPLDPTHMTLPTTNGSAGAAVESTPAPSVEALLFKSGAISADQLGELVRDAVLTQRPVAAIALERGLATTEMLAALQARAGLDVSAPSQVGEVSPAPHEAVSTEPAVVAPAPLPELADIVVSPLDTGTVAPASEPQELVAESESTTALPRLEPVESLEERVRAAVMRAAQAPPSPAAPVAPDQGPETVALREAAPTPAATAVFAVLVRLQTGERLTAGTTGTLESAVEIARSLAEQLAEGDAWPLIAGRCIRPDHVVSVDIEQTLDG
jgi:hypothetical protein